MGHIRNMGKMLTLAGLVVLWALLGTMVARSAPVPDSEGFPRIFLYGGLASSGSPLIQANGAMDMVLARQIARFPTVTMPLTNLVHRPGIYDTLRLLSPTGNIRIIAYHLHSDWFLDSTFTPAPTDTIVNAEWHRELKNTHGFRASNGTCACSCPPCPPITSLCCFCNVDWGQLDVREVLGNRLLQWGLGKMDGFFFDFGNTIFNGSGANCGFRTVSEDSAHTQWFRGFNATARTLKPGFVVCVNFQDGIAADGTFREGFYPGGLTTFANVTSWQATSNHDFDVLKGADDPQPPGHTNFFSATVKRDARRTNAAAALFGVRSTVGPQNVTTPEPQWQRWWWDEYAVAPDGNADTTGTWVGWLGQPTGARTQLTANVWWREFERGAVLLNENGSAVNADIGSGNYRRILGKIDRTHNNGTRKRIQRLAAFDAVFLVKVPH